MCEVQYRYLVIALSLHAAGCTFNGSTEAGGASGDAGDNRVPNGDGGSDPGGDGGDNTPDATAICQSFSSYMDTCAITMTSGGLDLSMTGEYKYDTMIGTLEDPNGLEIKHESGVYMASEGEIRIVLVDSFLLGPDSSLRAEGPMPFGIASFGDVQIQGFIDVGSDGAGARGKCETSSGSNGGDNNGGAGGGGGGGFQGPGGAGGEGDGDGASQGAAGAGGLASTVPLSPIGGCRGGRGGDGEDPGGKAGRAGGAVYLASATLISISGGIQAGGQGGEGGDESGGGFADAGGGGGGSGGYILLEAPSVNSSGVLAANGGAGGEGSGDGDGGNDGQDGQASDLPAAGGTGGSPTGSDGAVGSAAATVAGGSVLVSEAGGAGGGGGGTGFIFVLPSQSLGGITSPPAL